MQSVLSYRLILYRNWFWSAHERPTLGLPDQSDSRGAGDRWSLIVIRDLMLGNRRHFRELLTRSGERIAAERQDADRRRVG